VAKSIFGLSFGTDGLFHSQNIWLYKLQPAFA